MGHYYYISKLVCVLGLVNLAGPTHRLLKCKVFLLPNCRVIYHQIFSTYEANSSLKLALSLNCVLECANDLKKLRVQIDSFCFQPCSEI